MTLYSLMQMSVHLYPTVANITFIYKIDGVQLGKV